MFDHVLSLEKDVSCLYELSFLKDRLFLELYHENEKCLGVKKIPSKTSCSWKICGGKKGTWAFSVSEKENFEFFGFMKFDSPHCKTL
jgi:hypothetical protein